MLSPRSRTAANLLDLIGFGALAFAALHLLHLCGGPLATPDVWWHLAMGEVYATEGPWPEGGDPLLHTAHDAAPVQHEWLFGVALHGIERAFGLRGVRAAHVLGVLAILLLVYSLFRHEAATRAEAAVALLVFVLLGWWRVMQVRPDLVSIPAAFGLYRLLLESGRPPGRARIAAAALLLLLWANAHSLFAIGLLLLAAALAGVGLRAGLPRWLGMPAPVPGEGALAGRLAAALGIGAAATLVNPRGIAQHATFFTSSREHAIWSISDEWMHFDPFSPAGYGDAVSLPAWIAANAVGAALVVAGAAALARLRARRSEASLRAADPVLFGLGVAGVLATLVSVRFLWMLGFALLYLLRARRLAGTPQLAIAAPLGALLAATGVAIAIAFPQIEGFRARAERVPGSVAAYLATDYDGPKFFDDGVRFLEATGIDGRLFNTYPMGGYLGYWLAPRVRTFVDSRTEHYPPEVLEDYFRVTEVRGARPGETFLDVLDRRGVDVFFGTGMPTLGAGRRYTAAHLEGLADWILVSRSTRHGIYLRRGERGEANLARVVDYYAREGVPFDPERGLDVAEVIRARPDWAAAHGLLPPDYARLAADRESPDPGRRFEALDALGTAHALTGNYAEGAEIEREALRIRSGAKGPRRRLVYDLLRLDQPVAALIHAKTLQELDPRDPISARFFETARRYAELRSRAPDGAQAPELRALVTRLPLG